MYTLSNCYYNKLSRSYHLRIKPEVLLEVAVPNTVSYETTVTGTGYYLLSLATLPEEAEFIHIGCDSTSRLECFNILLDSKIIVDSFYSINSISYVVELILSDPHDRERKIKHFYNNFAESN